MKTYTVSQAKAQLSALIERVAAGEEVAIGRRGRPEVLLRRFDEGGGRRPLGTYEGPLELAEDFDAPLSAAMLVEPHP